MEGRKHQTSKPRSLQCFAIVNLDTLDLSHTSLGKEARAANCVEEGIIRVVLAMKKFSRCFYKEDLDLHN